MSLSHQATEQIVLLHFVCFQTTHNLNHVFATIQCVNVMLILIIFSRSIVLHVVIQNWLYAKKTELGNITIKMIQSAVHNDASSEC